MFNRLFRRWSFLRINWLSWVSRYYNWISDTIVIQSRILNSRILLRFVFSLRWIRMIDGEIFIRSSFLSKVIRVFLNILGSSVVRVGSWIIRSLIVGYFVIGWIFITYFAIIPIHYLATMLLLILVSLMPWWTRSSFPCLFKLIETLITHISNYLL